MPQKNDQARLPDQRATWRKLRCTRCLTQLDVGVQACLVDTRSTAVMLTHSRKSMRKSRACKRAKPRILPVTSGLPSVDLQLCVHTEVFNVYIDLDLMPRLRKKGY